MHVLKGLRDQLSPQFPWGTPLLSPCTYTACMDTPQPWKALEGCRAGTGGFLEEARLPLTPTPTAPWCGTDPGAQSLAAPQDTAATQPMDQSIPGQHLCPVPDHQTCAPSSAPTAQHKDLPASELSLVHRSPPRTSAPLTSSLFTCWGNICTSLHQQVSHSHVRKTGGTWRSRSWGLPALGTSLAAVGKRAPLHSGVLPGGKAAQQGSQSGWGLPTAYPKPCLVGSRADSPTWQQ